MNKLEGACSQHPEGCPDGSHIPSNEDMVAELEAAAAKWVLEKNKYTLECLRDARKAVLNRMLSGYSSAPKPARHPYPYCDCHYCLRVKKHPQLKPHHAQCGCSECTTSVVEIDGIVADRDRLRETNARALAMAQAEIERLQMRLKRYETGFPGFHLVGQPIEYALPVSDAVEVRAFGTRIDAPADETSPDFRGLLEEMWKFWGRPREEEFIDAGVSVERGMDLYCRVSAALGDPICAKCDRRFSQHKTVIYHDFTHRPLTQETKEHSVKGLASAGSSAAVNPRDNVGGSAEPSGRPAGKPCTCDNCLGSSTSCRVDAGERLGELWYCRKRAEKASDSRRPHRDVRVAGCDCEGCQLI